MDSVMRFYFFAVVFSVIVSAAFLSPFVRGQQLVGAADKSPAIRLVLQTSKAVYQVGEPIDITSYLENVSGPYEFRFYYVGRVDPFFLDSNWLHFIELSIRDWNGREFPIGRGTGDGFWHEGTTIEQKLARAYVELGSGSIYGGKMRLEWKLKPGRYKLQTVYREFEALRWSKAERDTLKVPVWTDTLRSKTVTIKVMPEKKKKSSASTR